MACCFVWRKKQDINVDLLDSTGQYVVPAIREDWLQMVRSQDPKRCRNVFTRLTADAVALYESPPPSLRSSIVSEHSNGHAATKRPTARTRPIDVILLRSLSQLLGRGKGSYRMRLVNAYGDWWEFDCKTPDDKQKWVEAISMRLSAFRTAYQCKRCRRCFAGAGASQCFSARKAAGRNIMLERSCIVVAVWHAPNCGPFLSESKLAVVAVSWRQRRRPQRFHRKGPPCTGLRS